jgi:potassium-transporting ATPase KdpC subunit
MTLFTSHLRPAAARTVVMTLLLGLAYPLAMTGIAQTLFPQQANGSLIERNGIVIGSSLIGQDFSDPRYLHGRPSAAAYDAANSTGSNLGPSSHALIEAVKERVQAVRTLDGTDRPGIDRVTASASGLDPHISIGSALAQADRIARLRGVEPDEVRRLLRAHVEGSYLGFIGEPVVNVLRANLALDATFTPAHLETTPSDE